MWIKHKPHAEEPIGLQRVKSHARSFFFIIIIIIIMLAPRKLEDSEAAEQYCAEIGRADAYMQFVSYLPFQYFIYLCWSF